MSVKKRRGGRHGVENPRRNLIPFKVTDPELIILDIASELFESRSEMIRILLFDFVFQLDPERVKEYMKPEQFKILCEKIFDEQNNDE